MSLYGLERTEHKQKDSSILEYSPANWAGIHNEAIENDIFFKGDTRAFIDDVIYTSFTDNAKAIPNVDFNITEFMIVHISNMYVGRDELSDNKGETPPSTVDIHAYKEALQDVSDNFFLHSVGFLYIHKNNQGEITFQSISPADIVYDWNFNKVCIKVGSHSVGKSTFEYYEREKDGCRCAIFTANDFFDAGTNPFELSDREKERIGFTVVGKFKEMPIVPLFKNRERIAYLSPIARLHKFLVVMVGFALAGIPMSVFIKLVLKTANQSNKDIKDGFADMMNLLNIGIEDSLDKLNTGDGEAFLNFLRIMEALLAMMGQLLGLPKSNVGSGIKEVRKSGASKYQDNLPAMNFRRRRIMKFDSFERKIFNAVKKIYPKLSGFDFRPIDKDNESLIFDAETLQGYLIEGIKSGLMPYTNAIAIKYGVKPEVAIKLADQAKKEFKKYKDLISGKSENKEVAGGIKKSDLKDKNYKNDEEDDANE